MAMDPRARSIMAFDRAAQGFEAARSRVVDVAGEQIARGTQHRMGSTGADVSAFVPAFRRAFVEADEAKERELEKVAEGLSLGFGPHLLATAQEALAESAQPVEIVKVHFKAMFFFVRAYQDALYAVLFAAITGNRAGAGKGMTQALNEANPVGAFLRQRTPDYLEWFKAWRDLRNAVKDGANFALVWPDGELAVTFMVLNEDGGVSVDASPSRATGLRDVTTALDSSADVSVALARYLEAI